MRKDDRIAVLISEAAKLADVSPSTIRREVEAGNLVAVKMRGKPLILTEWLRQALSPPRK